MRTTLSIDNDVAAARVLAQEQGHSIGEVVSELARRGLKPVDTAPQYRNGIRLMPVRPGAGPVTMELVNKLRDQWP